MVVTKIGDKHMFSQTFQWENLQKIKETISLYSIITLKDAARLLHDRKEIDILANQNHQFDIDLKILPDGIKAMTEWAYIWKIIKPIFLVIGAVATLITGVYAVVKIWG